MFVRNCSLTPKLLFKKNSNNGGFTLIELVIGIVVLSVALMVMTGALFPQAERSTNPWFQVRSAELAQSMMNEILARRYDENTAQIGSLRCNEDGAGDCLDETNLPMDCSVPDTWTDIGEVTRDLFDDVDDFHCYNVEGDDITNIENEQLLGVYNGFAIDITVQYAGLDLGFSSNTDAKLITVRVTPPKGDVVVYASYRANY